MRCGGNSLSIALLLLHQAKRRPAADRFGGEESSTSQRTSRGTCSGSSVAVRGTCFLLCECTKH